MWDGWIVRARKRSEERTRYRSAHDAGMLEDMTENATEVLVVGAGPTGLFLALLLAKLGVSVRVVDKEAESGTTSRALAVQARTLELYRQVGLAEEVVSRALVFG